LGYYNGTLTDCRRKLKEHNIAFGIKSEIVRMKQTGNNVLAFPIPAYKGVSSCSSLGWPAGCQICVLGPRIPDDIIHD